MANKRATALEDASPAAVAALFANVYPAPGVQYRGCSSPPGNTASNCVYRDGNDLLSLTVSLFPRRLGGDGGRPGELSGKYLVQGHAWRPWADRIGCDAVTRDF